MKCPIKRLESECVQKECPFYGSGCGLADMVQSIIQLEEQLDSLGDKIDGLAESSYEGFKRV